MDLIEAVEVTTFSRNCWVQDRFGKNSAYGNFKRLYVSKISHF